MHDAETSRDNEALNGCYKYMRTVLSLSEFNMFRGSGSASSADDITTEHDTILSQSGDARGAEKRLEYVVRCAMDSNISDQDIQRLLSRITNRDDDPHVTVDFTQTPVPAQV